MNEGVFMNDHPNILIMPDSFKGTMSSARVCKLIDDTLHKLIRCSTVCIPMADGGEGTIDCLSNILNWTRINTETKGPNGQIISADYLISGDSRHLALIESAKACGLSLAGSDPDPGKASTYGVGLLIKDAVLRGCREIYIALGGSCTNDAGAGACAAMGTIFTDKDGKEFIPVGENLNRISHIDNSAMEKLINGCRITAICDVNNPLYGNNGAALVFAPQKGADLMMAEMLDKNLRYFSKIVYDELSVDLSDMKRAGACGGFAAGIAAFMHGNLCSGIDTILDIIDFNNVIKGFDMIITGEGCLDMQSLSGKAVIGISSRVKKLGTQIPVYVFAGKNMLDKATLNANGIARVYVTTPSYMLTEQIKLTCEENMVKAAERFVSETLLSSVDQP